MATNVAREFVSIIQYKRSVRNTLSWDWYCRHLRSKHQKQYQFFFFKWSFRVKILTFRFGCSQTLNSKCWRRSWSYWKSCKPMIFCSITQPCSWHTSGGEERMVEVMTLYLSRWWKTKVMETLTSRRYLWGS